VIKILAAARAEPSFGSGGFEEPWLGVMLNGSFVSLINFRVRLRLSTYLPVRFYIEANYNSLVAPTDPAWKPTEGWRLLPPPPLSYFDNNCQVELTMKARYAMSKENDDRYFSKFNGTEMQLRDLDSRLNGTPNYAFTPGAPVSSFADHYISLSSFITD
jgi:hypothetical protein